MGYVGFKINKEEEKELQELEKILRSMDPLSKISNRSAAVKESVKIALFYLKQTYFYNKDLVIETKGLTGSGMSQTAIHQTRYIERIQGRDIDLDGRRKSKIKLGAKKV